MMKSIICGLMKKWLKECFTEEYDQKQILELSYEYCVKAINRCYDGGYEQFIVDNDLFENVKV